LLHLDKLINLFLPLSSLCIQGKPYCPPRKEELLNLTKHLRYD